MVSTAWGFDINNATDFQGALPDALAEWHGEVEKLLMMEKYSEAKQKAEERLSADKAGAAHALAKVFGTQNSMDEAKSHVDTALKAFIADGDVRGEAAALVTASKLAVDRGDFDQAAELAGDARDKYATAGSKSGEAAAHLALARLHQRKGDADEALAQLEKAADFFEKARDKEGQAAASLLAGNLFLWSYRDAAEDAVRLGREAAQLLRKVNRPSCHHREGDALFLVATASLMTGKFRDALKAAKEAVDLHNEWGGSRAQVSSLRAVAMAHIQINDLGMAQQVTDQAMALAKGCNDEYLQAQVLVCEAMVCRQRAAKGGAQDLGELVGKQREVLEKFVKLGDDNAAALHRLELAQAVQLSGDFAVAQTEATMACEHFKTQEMTQGQGLCLLTIAMCQYANGGATGDVATALETAKKAQSLLDSCGGSPEAGELVELLKAEKKHADSKNKPEEFKTSPAPAAQRFDGVPRSMYSDMIHQRIRCGDTEPLCFDHAAVMYMDLNLGVPMPFLKDSAGNKEPKFMVPPLNLYPRDQMPPPPEPNAPSTKKPSRAADSALALAAGRDPDRPRPAEEPKAPIVIRQVVVGSDLLGGRNRDVPDDVHDRMVALAKSGAIPTTSLPQRQALERKKPTFHGHADWRDAARYGYIHPTISAPKGCKWQKASVGWKLTGPPASELVK